RRSTPMPRACWPRSMAWRAPTAGARPTSSRSVRGGGDATSSWPGHEELPRTPGRAGHRGAPHPTPFRRPPRAPAVARSRAPRGDAGRGPRPRPRAGRAAAAAPPPPPPPSPPAASSNPPLHAASISADAARDRPVSPAPRVAPERADWPEPFVPRAPSAAGRATPRGAESERAGTRAPLPPAIVPKPPLPVAEVRPTSPAARPARARAAPRAAPDGGRVPIGRIDGRAVRARPDPPAAKPARAPRPQPLALEAFLEGRRHP